MHERFWAKVLKPIGLDGCWEWTGAILANGYGQFFYRGKPVSAHRVSWILHHGPIPDGKWILHHCDNPPCVRPDHLYLGSALDNTRDAIVRGRLAAGDRHGMRRRPDRRPFGERNGMTSLDAGRVRAIRRLASEGRSMRSLAPEFGVGASTIENIVHRRTWSHLK